MLRILIGGLTISAVAMAGNVQSSVTVNRDVLPILQKNCQGCHRPGQVAPMSFLNYQNARPWAKAIREAVLARKMPPWSADSAIWLVPERSHLEAERDRYVRGLGGCWRAEG